MSRTTIKLVMALAMLGFIAQGASAFGHRCGGWGRGYCGYGGYGGCGYGGWGYAGYGGYGGWGYGAYGGSGYGGYYGQTRVGYSAALVQAAPAAAAPNTATLTVDVPRDAQIFVNGRPTTSTGEHREYISRDLKTNAQYTYKVRAEFTRDGQPVSEEKTVQLIAGQRTALSFSASSQLQTADTAPARR